MPTMTWLSTMIGRRRREILLVEIGDLDEPAFFAGFRVERDQVVVRCLEEQRVVPDGRTAIADVRGAARLPEVVPDFAAVERVERPHVVGGGDVQNAADLQNGALDRAAGELARAHAADDRRRQTAARSGHHCRHPREREILHVRRVDLLERAVPAARVVAGERRPLVGERLRERRRIDDDAVGVPVPVPVPVPGFGFCAISTTGAARSDVDDDKCFERHFTPAR